MAKARSLFDYLWSTFLLLCFLGAVSAQEEASCYGVGSIVAAVILTLIFTVALAFLSYFLWKRYRDKREKHLILETDPEKGKEEYAFDNPGFKDAGVTPIHKQIEKNNKLQSGKTKWTSWSPLSALTTKNEKRTTLDDSAMEGGETKVVSLRSHDFTGLGFNICGNMREGIFIKDVLHRGPASESGKLNPGDRVESVTINFEHMVYEDALTILSYASPYEVTIKAKSGKILMNTSGQGAQPGHPLFRSSSIADFMLIGSSAKKRLFQIGDHSESLSSNTSSLQKSRSNATTLERDRTNSPKTTAQKPDRAKKSAKKLTPEQLKSQLEQKILENHEQNVKIKNERLSSEPAVLEIETQKTENRFQKFGIRVLPDQQQNSPKSNELSQNDNNTNLEKYDKHIGLDEVDDTKPPIVKKREKNTISSNLPEKENQESFVRQGSINKSDIKRDANGIPQEIPSHMLNAAVSAQRNRKSAVEKDLEQEEIKATKKLKAKAPAPPEDKINNGIETEDDDSKTYHSDSDGETDNQSSVNTIELNPNDITIHQTSEDEKQNRKTASTGDLTKIHRTKSGTGTLERAQSLDITDAGIPALAKKRKAGRIEDCFDSKTNSDDSLYGNALINKEPRLSLILDGLNTFQRSRLKKSTEWGNLEDAILKKENDSFSSSEQMRFDISDSDLSRGFDFGSKSPEFDALVNKINEIKQETSEKVTEELEIPKIIATEVVKPKNQIWPVDLEHKENGLEVQLNGSATESDNNSFTAETYEIAVEPAVDEIEEKLTVPKNNLNHEIKLTEIIPTLENFLDAEKLASNIDLKTYYLEDTNISDDIKVSRHSLSSLERINKDKPEVSNVSNITINDKTFEVNFENEPNRNEDDYSSLEITIDKDKNDNNHSTVSDLYTTALDETISINKIDPTEKVVIKTTDSSLVTIEGPSSLTLDTSIEDNDTLYSSNMGKFPGEDLIKMKSPQDKNSTLTYITEIQVTPNTTNSSNISEIEIVPNVNNLDNKFENYVKNFEANIKKFETKIENVETNFKADVDKGLTNEKIDPEKELHKIQEIAEEQLKKLPEMRFTTSSYEGARPEKRQSQIELLRSNFEKNLPKTTKTEINTSKSRIPISTSMKTPPTSPERRDSRNLDLETDKEIIAIMTSSIHSTPAPSSLKYQSQLKTPVKNVTVTSIRSNSKIPSGLSTASRPPVPPRKIETHDNDETIVSPNNSFKQWVFNPLNNSVTNIVVENKNEQK